eukprot:365219-Chlamydomonas_euryale.AAC.10
MALVALSAVEALRSVRPVIAAAAAAIAADLRSQGRIPAPCIPQPVVPPASASWWPGLRCASSSTKPDFQAAALRNAGVQAIGGPRPAASPPREPGPEECCQVGGGIRGLTVPRTLRDAGARLTAPCPSIDPLDMAQCMGISIHVHAG